MRRAALTAVVLALLPAIALAHGLEDLVVGGLAALGVPLSIGVLAKRVVFPKLFPGTGFPWSRLFAIAAGETTAAVALLFCGAKGFFPLWVSCALLLIVATALNLLLRGERDQPRVALTAGAFVTACIAIAALVG